MNVNVNEALFNLVHKFRGNILTEIRGIEPDLSPMHMKSLKVISKIKDCTGQKLAGFMHRDKAQINRLIKELVSRDLVIKSDNKDDKRSHLLCLSEKGELLMQGFKRVEKNILSRMTQGLSEEQVDAFIKTAEQMQNNLN